MHLLSRSSSSLFAGLFAVTLVLVVGTTPVHAQWEVDAELDAGFGWKRNVFESPGELRASGAVLPSDSLRRNDIRFPLAWEVEVERDVGTRHTLAVELDQRFRPYQSYGVLNEQWHDLDVTHEMALPRDAELTSEASVSRSVSSGTDVEGDALTRNFARWTMSLDTELEKDWRRFDFEVGVEFEMRNYDATPGFDPLDSRQSEWTAEAEYDVPGVSRDQDVSLELEYTRRRYPEYVSTNAAGQSPADAPMRRYRYAGAEIGYEMDVTDDLEVELATGFRKRSDGYEGYYDYRRWTLGAGTDWEPLPDTRLALETELRHYRFPGKDAPQANGSAGTTPRLRYTYLDLEVEAERTMRSGVDVYATWTVDNRYTNVTAIDRSTRRPYQTGAFTLGARFDLDRLYREAR